MNEKIKFSIVVPVYNTSKYLRQCVDAIIHQTYTNWELILVDDGSTDESGSICDEYASKYNNIQVLHKKNGGILQARYDGRKLVTGDYIVQHDSDDYLEQNALEICYKYINTEKCDCLIIGQRVVINGCPNEVSDLHLNKIPDARYARIKMIINDESFNGIDLKVIKRGLLDHIDYSQYGRLSMGEDLLQSIEIWDRCEKISVMSEVISNYRCDNVESVTAEDSPNGAKEKLVVYDKVLSFIENEPEYVAQDFYQFLERYARAYFRVISFIALSKETFDSRIQKYEAIKLSSGWERFYDNTGKLVQPLGLYCRVMRVLFSRERYRAMDAWIYIWEIYRDIKKKMKRKA